ncbi:MAG: helix-turn-helix domain-containing protein [Snowella sp.]|nr:helix-turn-helix domain-containing protein [Snowella sp.]
MTELDIKKVTRAVNLADDSTEQQILIGLSKLSLAMKSQSWQDAGQHGLSPTQAQILSLLKAKDGSSMRLSEVAEGLGVTAATASDSVRVLKEKGLIQKKRSLQDGRAIAITLTKQGQALAIDLLGNKRETESLHSKDFIISYQLGSIQIEVP